MYYLKNWSSLSYLAGKQNAFMDEWIVLVLTNRTISIVVLPADSASTLHILPPCFCAPVLLWGSTMFSLSSLLPTFCFLSIPEFNNRSRFSSPLACPDFLSSFPNMSGYLTPWHMDFSAFSISRPSEHLSILLPNISLAFDWFRSPFKTPVSITFMLKEYLPQLTSNTASTEEDSSVCINNLCDIICMTTVYCKLLMK